MKHFLLTRWNLPGGLATPGLERVSDPGWRARRRDLFERYCLPSVAAQTVEDFTWLFLVFDALTPQEDLRWFRAGDERLLPVAVEDPQSPGTAEAKAEIERLLTDDASVITTRLDSDDMLHPDHLRRVRVEFEGERRVVEFAEGFYYDVLRDRMRHVRETQNAFVSVLEPADDIRTAFGWAHHEIGAENEIHYLDGPGWLALVHDRNAITYLWGERVPAGRKQEVLREFGVPRPPYLRTRARRLQALGRRAGRAVRRSG